MASIEKLQFTYGVLEISWFLKIGLVFTDCDSSFINSLSENYFTFSINMVMLFTNNNALLSPFQPLWLLFLLLDLLTSNTGLNRSGNNVTSYFFSLYFVKVFKFSLLSIMKYNVSCRVFVDNLNQISNISSFPSLLKHFITNSY